MNFARVSKPVTLSCFFRIFDTPLKVTTVNDSSMIKSFVNLKKGCNIQCKWRTGRKMVEELRQFSSRTSFKKRAMRKEGEQKDGARVCS